VELFILILIGFNLIGRLFPCLIYGALYINGMILYHPIFTLIYFWIAAETSSTICNVELNPPVAVYQTAGSK